MRYLHTMVRVSDLEQSLDFFCNKLGLKEVRRTESEQGRFTLIFLGADENPRRTGRADLQLGSRSSTRAAAISATSPTRSPTSTPPASDLMDKGVTINRPPRDGRMAFVKSPDGISIELLQQGEALAPSEPWTSMPNVGSW